MHQSWRNQIKKNIYFQLYAFELQGHTEPYWYGVPSGLFEILSTQSPQKS